MNNRSKVTEFVFLGLSNLQEHQVLAFGLFLIIYLLTLLGNSTIIAAIRTNPPLHTPMYFFLSNLALVDICYVSCTVPKMLSNFIADSRNISFGGCMAQLYFFVALLATECFLLTAMAFDRYCAICEPLRYATIMNRYVCVGLVAGSWMGGCLYSTLHLVLASQLSFCSANEIQHFFCDLPPLLALSCSNTSANEAAIFVGGMLIGLSTFLLVLISYGHIFSTVIKTHADGGRHRAFSTCGSHLAVFILFFGTLAFVYMRPASSYSLQRDRLVSVVYSVLTPTLNPLIYSLRNKEMKRALRQVMHGKCAS
ncbi:olfactory receptor 5V1-like [Emydura macquarii macquarii]|uniref:olfactory receptor 5V1-like n=1 Tax=Emydura macquarii macquarii TaxID=1129001 RepID=UPI00352AE549